MRDINIVIIWYSYHKLYPIRSISYQDKALTNAAVLLAATPKPALK